MEQVKFHILIDSFGVGSICPIVLWKSTHGWKHLTRLSKRGWLLFRVFPHLPMEEHPCHVYSNLMLLKQMFGQIMMYNGTTSSFEVKSWWHTTLWNGTMSPRAWCSSWCALHYFSLSTQRCLVVTIGEAFLMHSAETGPLKLVPGWPLIWVNVDPIQDQL